MARAKKVEEKAEESATLQISLEDFVRTRDSVVLGLATLQSAVQDLSHKYIAHTNTVIGRGPGAQPDLLNVNYLSGQPLFENRAATPAANATAPANPEGGETKKRKRAPHDKNAPKRPVTPYFLYMQTARSIIANEMPPGHHPKEVAEEGTRRWLTMPEDEKNVWSYKYGINFARYKEKVKAYKAGQPIPEISDEDAKKLYDDQVKSGKMKVDPPLNPGGVEGHEEEEEDEDEDETNEDSSSSSSSEEEPPPPPVKAPTPPKSSRASKRQKGAAPEKKVSPVVSPPVEVAVKSPEVEKKKKGSKKKETAEPKAEPVVAPVSSPPKLTQEDSMQKPKKSRKKRKSEIADE